jgi:hypothetical protein
VFLLLLTLIFTLLFPTRVLFPTLFVFPLLFLTLDVFLFPELLFNLGAELFLLLDIFEFPDVPLLVVALLEVLRFGAVFFDTLRLGLFAWPPLIDLDGVLLLADGLVAAGFDLLGALFAEALLVEGLLAGLDTDERPPPRDAP